MKNKINILVFAASLFFVVNAVEKNSLSLFNAMTEEDLLKPENYRSAKKFLAEWHEKKETLTEKITDSNDMIRRHNELIKLNQEVLKILNADEKTSELKKEEIEGKKEFIKKITFSEEEIAKENKNLENYEIENKRMAEDEEEIKILENKLERFKESEDSYYNKLKNKATKELEKIVTRIHENKERHGDLKTAATYNLQKNINHAYQIGQKFLPNFFHQNENFTPQQESVEEKKDDSVYDQASTPEHSSEYTLNENYFYPTSNSMQ